MEIFQQILFSLLFIASIYLFSKRIGMIRHLIMMGQPEVIPTNTNQRWKNVFLLALGQKKMFKKPLVALMHLIVYLGFIIINIEMIEIIVDGIFGTHRILFALIPSFYTLLIDSFEFLAIGVILACIIFLVRRNIIKIKRFSNDEINGWPAKDAKIILFTEIILMLLFLKMNATDTFLQTRGVAPYAEHITGNFFFSSYAHPLLNNF